MQPLVAEPLEHRLLLDGHGVDLAEVAQFDRHSAGFQMELMQTVVSGFPLKIHDWHQFFDFGRDVYGIGDIDADGFDDFAATLDDYSRGHRDSQGKRLGVRAVYVISGYDESTLLRPAADQPLVGDVNGDGVEDSYVNGQILSGREQSVLLQLTEHISAVGPAGDVNEDGFDDVLLYGGGAGVILSGHDGETLHAANLKLNRDVNGDGHDDLIFGARDTSPSGAWTEGTVTIASGLTEEPIRTFTETNEGVLREHEIGTSADIVGDINGDGVPEVAIGSIGVRGFHVPDRVGISCCPVSSIGFADVYSGVTWERIYRVQGTRVFYDGEFLEFGAAVRGVGDTNGDKLADFLVAAPHDDFDHGQIYLFESPLGFKLPQNVRAEGASVAALFGERIHGADGAAAGVAIFRASGTGTWQYSIDGGVTYAAVGEVVDERSLLLGPDSRIRYVKRSDAAEVARLHLRVWDMQAGHAPGARIDTSVNGPGTPFSARDGVASLKLVAQQELPVVSQLNQAIVIPESGLARLEPIFVSNVAANEPIHAQLDVTGGRLHADLDEVVVVSGLPRDESGDLSLVGTVDQVNSALAQVRYSTRQRQAASIAVRITVGAVGNDTLVESYPASFAALFHAMPTGSTSGARQVFGTISLEPDIPERLGVGDANRDGVFDMEDIVAVLAAGKFMTNLSATWSEGDWNLDGRFDQLDLVAALASGNWMA